MSCIGPYIAFHKLRGADVQMYLVHFYHTTYKPRWVRAEMRDVHPTVKPTNLA